MKLFRCQSCGQHVYFENVRCTRCGHTLGFLADRMEVSALEDAGDGLWHALAAPESADGYRACANSTRYEVCNWMVPRQDPDPLCRSCRLNRTIPDLSIAGNHTLWQRLEAQKRRLVYSLLRLDLSVQPKQQDPSGLAFDFLSDFETAFNETGRVLTGHADGLITLNVAEADPATRERMRQEMAEPYRTILGHFRHESGHYFWERLVRDTHWLQRFRSLFGDETQDYRSALKRHHTEGPPPDWPQRFVTAYASAHPWEDWAETWAHYLHIVDTLETALSFGVGLDVCAQAAETRPIARPSGFDPCQQPDFEPILAHWLPLAFALNNLNRSIGHEDAYPFVLAPAAVEKLDLVHRIIQHPDASAGNPESVPGP